MKNENVHEHESSCQVGEQIDNISNKFTCENLTLHILYTGIVFETVPLKISPGDSFI